MTFRSFDEFWPHYLGEHRDRRNRALHYVGTLAALSLIAVSVLTAHPRAAFFAPLVGYAPPWIGHFFIERNRPATFRHPLWSLRGDFRMLRLALLGRVADELARVGG